jgi:hypothetical protein
MKLKALGKKTITLIATTGAVLFFSSLVNDVWAVPSFARQTGIACEGCHTVFPELTPFGRSFKLSGYLIDNLPQVKAVTSENKEALLLNWMPPLSMMLQTSYTSTSKALPDPVGGANSQNGQVLLPQQASLLYAGRIAPKIGGFIQMTYASDSGTFGWDNTDIRFADHATVSGKDLVWGVSFNNNPTVQDVWNSTPAWQMPFDQRSNAAPTPMVATQIDGTLAGNVAGLTVYGYFANSWYAEFGAYRSAPQGFSNNQISAAGPLDSTATNVVHSSAPYWRIAYEWQQDRNSWTVGAFGLDVDLNPGDGIPLGGLTNHYRDTAVDTQYQFIGDDSIYSVQAVYIKENQSLDAAVNAGTAENVSNTLKTLRVAGSYYYQRTYGAALGYFSTTGSSDALQYSGTSAVIGSANGSPDSKGWVAEVSYIPWQNVKFSLQYTLYNRFNGGSDNYDGFGRNAKDNNTLYLLGWFNF